MDALLPSEIARLVLGYLQEQKCQEAARSFMETSPHLQECRIVAQRGGRYSTKVGGLSLVDILDKYCTANALVQEKLSKVSDCDQIKQCNDLIEQLRYLLEGSRGQCFVVNISVPSQSSPAGAFGSPIVSGSTRKRHHSNSERGKRVAKSLSNLMDKPNQDSTSQSCNIVETTPLKSLPGHTTKQTNTENHKNTANDKSLDKTDFVVNTLHENILNFPMATSTGLSQDPNLLAPNYITTNSNCKDQSTETVQKLDEQTQNTCTAETSTEELMNYCSTEVQTGFADFLDINTDDVLQQSEKNIHEEAIENLTIVHTELLQNKELQEQLAENINKIVYESATDPNVSLLSVVKSAVEATDNDPVFDKFLHELFMVRETDTSPDEDSDARQNQESNDQIYARNDEPMDVENNVEFIELVDSKINGEEPSGLEVPLKQRLRSSFKSQGANVDEEEKESNSLLENQNEEAVRSIVNVIASKRNSLINNELNTENIPPDSLPENVTTNEPPKLPNGPLLNNKVELEKPNGPNKTTKLTETNKTTKPRKTTRKPKTPKPKQNAESVNNAPVLLPETDLMPTLILCTEKDVESVLPANRGTMIPPVTPYEPTFLPIAPKVDDAPSKPPAPKLDPTPVLYLRTVNVPRHLVNPATLEASKKANPLLLQTTLHLQQQTSPQKLVNATDQQQPVCNDPIVVPIVVTDDKSTTTTAAVSIPSIPPVESITLYGGGENNSNTEMKVTPISSMPVISLDDSIINLATSTGLSPFFKGVVSSVASEAASTSTGLSPFFKGVGGTVIGEAAIASTGLSPYFKGAIGSVAGEAEIAGTGLSPFFKSVAPNESTVLEEIVDEAPKEESKPEQTRLEPEKETLKADVEEAKVDVEPMEETSTKPEEKIVARRHSIEIGEALIAKRTPRTLIKARAKNNRLSLSTPRRRTSHVRALDFNTPVKHDGTTRKTPQSCTRSKSVCRAGLFKSPPFSSNASNINLRTITVAKTQTVKKVRTISPVKNAYLRAPIATRSPVPKLQGNWGKVTGIGMILGEASTSESSPEKSQTECILPIVETVEKESQETKVIAKKSWDSDLRKTIGATVNEDQEEKSRPKSAKKGTGKKRLSSVKEEDSEESEKKLKTKSKLKINDTEKDSPNKKAQNVEEKVSDSNKKPIVQEPMETSSPPNKKLDAKCNDENKPKNANIIKTSPEFHGHLSRISALELETPRKTEMTNCVPPTPRILITPGDSLRVQRTKQLSDVSIKACVDTPDFPVTPCIVYTPKVIDDDGDKKPSPYYEPDEQTQLEKPKEIVNTTKTTVIVCQMYFDIL